MRLSNKKRINYYNFLLTLVNLILIGGIGAYILDKTRLGRFGNMSILFIVLPVFLLVLYKLRGREIFEYDSEGEVVHFKNRNVIYFMGKESNDEFPKYKISSFDLVDAIIFKRLYIKIKSKKEQVVLLKYDISYLSKKELKDLKFSLTNIVAANEAVESEGKMQS